MEQEGFRHNFLPIASLDDVKSCIDAGFPVLVYVPSHVFAIVGYDDTLETFVTYDVATRDVWVDYIRKDFIKSWKRQSTTLVLVYPPEEENRIPSDIRQRLVKLSDNYLHFQLNYLDGPKGYAGSAHLLRGFSLICAFFPPVTILYKDFPGLRSTLSDRYDCKLVSKEIFDYFGNDFDEGTHLWGQYHFESIPHKDRALDYGIAYLIGQRELTMANDLIVRIEEQGMISENTKETSGMIDLALGNFESGVQRLTGTEKSDAAFYLAQGQLMLDNRQAAISGLVKALAGCT